MMDCGDGIRRANNGSVGVVAAKTASYTININEAGKMFTNKGAGGAVTFTLPAPKEGAFFKFAVIAAQNIVVTATGGAKIDGGSANGSINCASTQALAGSAEVFCPDGTNWIALKTGTWT